MDKGNKKKEKELIYLDTYILQKDMRVRLPKAVLNNLNIQKGITKFAIFLDSEKKEIIFKIAPETLEEDHG